MLGGFTGCVHVVVVALLGAHGIWHLAVLVRHLSRQTYTKFITGGTDNMGASSPQQDHMLFFHFLKGCLDFMPTVD